MVTKKNINLNNFFVTTYFIYTGPLTAVKMYHIQSTYQADFKNFGFDGKCREWKYEDIKIPKTKPCISKDGQTLEEWKPGTYVPFNTLWEPKPILEPMPKPKITEEKPKTERRTFKTTTIMSPMVCLEDVEDQDQFNTVMQYMYTPLMEKTLNESVPKVKPKPVPSFDHVIYPAVDLKPNPFANIPLKWRKRYLPWDIPQSRALGNPTNAFWKRRDDEIAAIGENPKHVKNLVSKETSEKITDLLLKDKLSPMHMRQMQGYTGKQSLMCLGVPMEAKQVPVEHPFVTVYQALTRNRKKQ